MEGNYPRPGEKMDFNKSACKETLFQITLGNRDLGARCFVEIKHSIILFRNPFSATGLEPSSMRRNRCEGIYSRKLLGEEKWAEEFAICYHTDGNMFFLEVYVIIKEKKLLFVDVFLPLVLQQLYLHGLHHKLSWSSPNKARHFFGVFASVSQRGRHKHTHRDKKKKERKEKKKMDTSLHRQKHVARA